METLYVVTCQMDGCEECGNSYHVVGVYSNLELADAAEKEHNKYYKKYHLHSIYTDIVEKTLNK